MPNFITFEDLVVGTSKVLPTALDRVYGVKVLNTRITDFKGTKMKVFTSNILSSEKDKSYSVTLAFYGIEDPENAIPSLAEDKIGVRCSCFTGDTLVMLANGTSVPIKDLVNEKYFYVYSFDEVNKRIEVAKAFNAHSNGVKEVIEVTLDNGQSIKCTEDHKFMLNSGEYIEAGKLTEGDSLKACYRSRNNNGYPTLFTEKTKEGFLEVPAHELADNYNLRHGLDNVENGVIRHHKNFNKDDNNPENIIRMTPQAHNKLHVELGHRSFQNMVNKYGLEGAHEIMRKAAHKSNEVQKLRGYKNYDKLGMLGWESLKKNRNFAWNDQKWLDKKSIEMSQMLKKLSAEGKHPSLHKSEAWKQSMSESMKIRCQDPVYMKKMTMGVKFSQMKRDNLIPPLSEINDDYMKQYHLYDWFTLDEFKQYAENSNHKVLSIKRLGKEEVFDITVPEFHNFVIDVDNGNELSSGVVVHNCDAYYYWMSYANRKAGCNYGARFAPYIHVTPPSGRKPLNPHLIPGCCKHILHLAQALKSQELVY